MTCCIGLPLHCSIECSYNAVRNCPRWRPTFSFNFRSADSRHRQLWRHGGCAVARSGDWVEFPVSTTRRSSAGHHRRHGNRHASPRRTRRRLFRRRAQKPETEVRRQRPRRKWNWRRACGGSYRKQYGGGARRWRDAGRRWRHQLRRQLQLRQWRHAGRVSGFTTLLDLRR